MSDASAPNWAAIPAELASRQQWLVWKFEPPRKNSTKPIKMPYYVSGGRRVGTQGDDRDRMKLATLPVARRMYERGGWNGVGFAFLPGDGLIGIDIDNAINLETGEMSDLCKNVIERCNSYTERSPSGKGVHIIVRGHTDINKSDDIGLEVYCSKLYFTVTTDRLPGMPAEVQEISEEALEGIHSRINEAKEFAAALRASKVVQLPTRKAPPSAGDSRASGEDDFRKVNDAAMASFDVWVPVLFKGKETRSGRGYRVSSEALGRDLQEDLSIKPDGIVDFGVADMGDAREGRRSPIDLVIEWLPMPSAKDALHWLAKVLGVEIRKPGERHASSAPAETSRSTDKAATAAGAGGGGEPPKDPPDDDDGPDDDYHLGPLRGKLIRTGSGKPADCRENVLYCMRYDPVLFGLVAHNQFTELHERTRVTPWGRGPGEWDEEDDLMLGEYLARTYHLLIKSTGTLRAGVLMAARVHKFNPVVDLVRSEKWDGTPRLRYWVNECLGVPQSPYTALIGSLFLKGMVWRAICPGCKFDYMLILKGPQGAKKSTVFRTLAQPWFTDNAIRMGDKDSLMALQSIWLAESSELESLNKSETNAIKQFLSASEDLFRPPYGARMVKRPRHAAFGGTTNADTFLKDVTGDRRFWPIEIQESGINIEKLQAWRMQLFAEALHMLEHGDAEQRRCYTTVAEERELVIPEQERFRMTDVWADIIQDYVSRKGTAKGDPADLPANARRTFFSTQELFDRALQIKADRIDGNKIMETRLGNCMRELGFVRHRETTAARKRGYLRPKPVDEGDTSAAQPPAGSPLPSGSPPEWVDAPPRHDEEEVPDDIPF